MAINSDISPENNKDITEMIHLVQGRPIVFDYDLANLYEMETKELNRLASKNSDYFPADFRFRLTKGEYKTLFPDSKGSLSPFAYAEQGITMFSMILKNPDSVASSLNIVRSFVEMRNFIAKNSPLFERISSIELKQLEFEKETTEKISKLLKAIDEQECAGSTQKIFFSGQIYDAYSFLIDLIKRAKENIILIDGYVNINTLDILRNKKEKIPVSILTLPSSRLSLNEIKKFNTEYPKLTVYKTSDFHDRLLILDEKEFYHVGASLKDAGEKSFAITKLEEIDETNLLLSRINAIKSQASQKSVA